MKIYNIPEGIPNIKSLFPTINFDEVEEWYIEIENGNDHIVHPKTRINVVGCCCDNLPISANDKLKTPEHIRIHFVNSFGTFDAINLQRPEELFEPKSDTWQKAVSIPLNRQDGGNKKFNIKSNENYTAYSSCYGEDDMYFLKELFSSIQCWLELPLPKGLYTSPTEKDYIPIILTDGKYILKKEKERFFYDLKVQFQMANTNFHLR